ncbi:MAG: hypothetical protein M0P57_11760 [Syntrophales bacterium]|nr:hypothetical protein [Syntrophales bacterium]MDY0045026.1 hypothetical protein [Syntrophales bacterium]
MEISKKKFIYRVSRIALGVMFLILGIAGFIFPILQGWLFVAIGAILLSRDIPLFRRLIKWIDHRFPRIWRAADRNIKKIIQYVKPLSRR